MHLGAGGCQSFGTNAGHRIAAHDVKRVCKPPVPGSSPGVGSVFPFYLSRVLWQDRGTTREITHAERHPLRIFR